MDFDSWFDLWEPRYGIHERRHVWSVADFSPNGDQNELTVGESLDVLFSLFAEAVRRNEQLLQHIGLLLSISLSSWPSSTKRLDPAALEHLRVDHPDSELTVWYLSVDSFRNITKGRDVARFEVLHDFQWPDHENFERILFDQESPSIEYERVYPRSKLIRECALIENYTYSENPEESTEVGFLSLLRWPLSLLLSGGFLALFESLLGSVVCPFLVVRVV